MRGSIFWKFLVITHVFEHLWPYFPCFFLKSHVIKKKILPILTKSKNYSENWSNFKTIPQQLLVNNWKYTPLLQIYHKIRNRSVKVKKKIIQFTKIQKLPVWLALSPLDSIFLRLEVTKIGNKMVRRAYNETCNIVPNWF